METRKCPYCQFDVPKGAAICGHCQKRLRMSLGAKLTLGMLGLVVFLGFCTFNDQAAKQPSRQPAAREQAPPPVEDELTAKGKAVKAKHGEWSNRICNLVAGGRITVGMLPDQARAAWGQPETVNRSGSSYGAHEQWVYPGSNYLYFTDGVLESWQTSE